jgi:hypothetical protein
MAIPKIKEFGNICINTKYLPVLSFLIKGDHLACVSGPFFYILHYISVSNP